MLRLSLPHLCHRVEEVFIRNAQRCEGPTGVRQVLTLKHVQFMSVTSPWTNSWNVPHSNCFLWTRQVDSWNSMGNPNFIGSYEMKEKNTIPREQCLILPLPHWFLAIHLWHSVPAFSHQPWEAIKMGWTHETLGTNPISIIIWGGRAFNIRGTGLSSKKWIFGLERTTVRKCKK